MIKIPTFKTCSVKPIQIILLHSQIDLHVFFDFCLALSYALCFWKGKEEVWIQVCLCCSVMGMYLLMRPHRSFYTHLLCRSGCGCHHSHHTKTGHKRWPVGRNTSGYCSHGMDPGLGSVHSEGPRVQILTTEEVQYALLLTPIKTNVF